MDSSRIKALNLLVLLANADCGKHSACVHRNVTTNIPEVRLCEHLSVYHQCLYIRLVRRDISVGIANRYGMNGTGIESRRGRFFPHLPRPARGANQSPI
jgi:hypothetical protein